VIEKQFVRVKKNKRKKQKEKKKLNLLKYGSLCF